MKAYEVVVNCLYDSEGESIQRIIDSSFASFLKQELEKFASTENRLV